MNYEELRDLINSPVQEYLNDESDNLEQFDAAVANVIDKLRDDNPRYCAIKHLSDRELLEEIMRVYHMVVNDLQSGELNEQASQLSQLMHLTFELARRAKISSNGALSWFYVTMGNEIGWHE